MKNVDYMEGRSHVGKRTGTEKKSVKRGIWIK